MSDYTLAGEIVLRDLFSASLDKLETGARSAETQVNKLGDEVDGIGAGAGIQPLLNQIDKLQAEAAAAQQSLDHMMKEVETTPALAKVKQLESAIANIKAKAGSGIPLTVGDVGEFHRLNSELVSLQGGLTGVQGKAAGVKSAFAGIGGMLAGLGLAFGGQQLIGGAIEMVKMGASADEMRGSFEALTTASNINGEEMLANIKKASFGTISEVDAMLIANRALLSEQGQMLASMPAIVTYAASVADAMGRSTLEVTQGIVEALSTGQVRSLRQFGINIAQKDALAAADALGQETDEMKRQQITAALTAEALGEMAKKQALMGENSRSTADDIDSLAVSWRELKTSMGEALVAAGVGNAIGDIAAGISPSNQRNFEAQSAAIEQYVTLLNKMGMSEEAAAAAQKRWWIYNASGMNMSEQIDAFQEMRSELEKMIGPLAQLPDSARDSGMILVGLKESMAGVAGTSPGELPAFVGQLRALKNEAGNAAEPFLTLTDRIREARAEAQGFVNTKTAFGAWGQAVSQYENKLLGLSDVFDTATIMQLRNRGERDLSILFNKMGSQTEFGMRLIAAQYADGTDTWVDAVRKAHTKMEEAQTKHVERMFGDAGSLRNAIEGALQGDMTVTNLDLQLSAEGKYRDKVNEAARQLQAIAERGFKELKVHPDWAAALKIPPEVLSGSEAQLKDWAGQTAQNVNANLRPDLINWDAFISNFKKGLEDNAAKNLTIDVAVGKLKEAGLLEADTQALRDQIAAQLGIKAPSLTIDTLFAADEGAGASLVKQVTGPTGYVEIPASLKYLTPAGTGENAGQGTTTALMPPTAMPTPTMPTGVDQVGTDMATSLLSGFNLTLANTDVGSVTLGVWSASFYAQSAGYGGIGTGMGHIMAGAFIEAMKDDFEGIQDTIAGWLLPAVERRLKRSSGGRGAID